MYIVLKDYGPFKKGQAVNLPSMTADKLLASGVVGLPEVPVIKLPVIEPPAVPEAPEPVKAIKRPKKNKMMGAAPRVK
jgi:hypothetical protein